MRDAIRHWLNGSRSYHEGVKLLLQYSTDQRLINCFKEPIETDFKRKRLAATLQELYEQHPAEKVKIAAPVQPPADKTWPVDNSNDVLASLREQWRPLYGEMTNLQARIHDVALQGQHDSAKAMEAHQMAEKIVQLTSSINEIYYQKTYFEKYGKLPEVEKAPAPEISPDQAFMRKKTVERYLRDLAKKLKRTELSDVKRNKWYPKWDTLTDELRSLNKILNRAENEGIPER